MSDVDAFHDPTTAALYAASNIGLFPQAKTSVYRYVGMRGDDAWARLESTVLHNTLPLTISTILNDPFEANPVIVNDVVSSDVKLFLNRFSKQEGITIAGLAFDVEMKGISGQESVDESKAFEAKFMEQLHSFISFRNHHCHIGSFSRRISSELQWSHYADGYKGLAYHFVTQPIIESGFRYLRSVRYSTQRPTILVSEILDQMSKPRSDHFTRAWLSFEQRSFLTKSTEWAYEEEERIIGQNVNNVRFLESELVSVIVGPRFPSESLERLKAVAAKRSRPLRLFRAQPSPTSYSIEVDWTKEL